MNDPIQSPIRVIIALLTLGIMGCGDSSDAPALSEAKGIVTYRKKPLANAQVLFTPQSGPMAIGQTDSEGRFSLLTGGKHGAMRGLHKVTVAAYEPFKTAPSGKEEEAQPIISRIPEKYSNLLQSGLTAEVKPAESNDFTFELMPK